MAAIVTIALRAFWGNVSSVDAVWGGTVNTLDEFEADPWLDTANTRSAGLIESLAVKKDEVRVTLKAAV